MISIEESYDYFISAFSRLDSKKLDLNDDQLGYEIFEELQSEAQSFLHERTVDRLIAGGLISSSLRERILNLRNKILIAPEVKHSILEYRYDSEWLEIRKEANTLEKIIKSSSRKTAN